MWHLGRVLAFGGILAVFAMLVAPDEVVAQKKDKKGKAAADNGYGATPEDYKAIVNKKELTGTIAAVSGKVVTLRMDSPHVEPNPKYKAPTGANANNNNQYRLYQEAQRLQRDYQQALNAKTPQQRAQAMQRYQQEYARYQQTMMQQNNQLLAKAAKDPNYVKNNANNTTDPFIVVHSYKEYDLETTDALVVRKTFLPFEYDDMGNVKTYTDKQKADLRDEKNKSYYKSKIEEISNGMEARLTLVPPKKKDKEAKADEDGVGNVDRPTISMIVLTKDSPAAGTGNVADPKKKKDKK